jgi:hypothetical protein
MNKTIGLLDVDYKRGRNVNNTTKQFPNLALMKISTYHKRKGDAVEWYSPTFRYKYDKIYASKVFSWKEEKDAYVPKDAIKGGSGFRNKDGELRNTKLPDEIEHIYPDYSLYGIDYALGFITRGCCRNCPWCIVYDKEGSIHKNADLDEFWNGQNRIMLLDNNLLAYEDHLSELERLRDTGSKVQFNQGLDIRLITEKNADILKGIPQWKGHRIFFAFDEWYLRDIIEEKLDILYDIGFTPNDFMFFMLVGFNTSKEEDVMRVKFLKERKLRPYVATFDPKDTYQRAIKRYVNFKPFFWKMSWEEFLEHDNHLHTRKYVKLSKEKKKERKNGIIKYF